MQVTTKNIVRLLKEKGISANKLLTELSLPNSAITQWKKGFASPSAKALQKIANYFELPISYFYEEHDNTTIEKVVTIPTPESTRQLTEEEKQLIDLILSLTDEEVAELSKFVDYIISKRK